jgi:hypothetical protein
MTICRVRCAATAPPSRSKTFSGNNPHNSQHALEACVVPLHALPSIKRLESMHYVKCIGLLGVGIRHNFLMSRPPLIEDYPKDISFADLERLVGERLHKRELIMIQLPTAVNAVQGISPIGRVARVVYRFLAQRSEDRSQDIYRRVE